MSATSLPAVPPSEILDFRVFHSAFSVGGAGFGGEGRVLMECTDYIDRGISLVERQYSPIETNLFFKCLRPPHFNKAFQGDELTRCGWTTSTLHGRGRLNSPA